MKEVKIARSLDTVHTHTHTRPLQNWWTVWREREP